MNEMKVDICKAYANGKHYVYALVNESNRQAYVGYACSANAMRAKAAKLQSDIGATFVVRVLVVKAYANETVMRNETLLNAYVNLYEQGYKMLNKRVPGSPLDKEKVLMQKPELWDILSSDSLLADQMPRNSLVKASVPRIVRQRDRQEYQPRYKELKKLVDASQGNGYN